jgi:hypothetical protein
LFSAYYIIRANKINGDGEILIETLNEYDAYASFSFSYRLGERFFAPFPYGFLDGACGGLENGCENGCVKHVVCDERDDECGGAQRCGGLVYPLWPHRIPPWKHA